MISLQKSIQQILGSNINNQTIQSIADLLIQSKMDSGGIGSSLTLFQQELEKYLKNKKITNVKSEEIVKQVLESLSEKITNGILQSIKK